MQATTVSGFVRYTLFNAPWALISTLNYGLSNYLIILILSFHYGVGEAGRFRLFLSIIQILSLFTLMDSGKIAVKNLIIGQRGVIWPLMMNRVKWGLLAVPIGIAIAVMMYQRGNDAWLPLLIATILLPVAMPTDMYNEINLARRQFRRNAFYSLTKFGSLTLLALCLALLDVNAQIFMSAYFAVVAAFHILFVTRHPETFEPENPEASGLKSQSVRLSAAGIFPILLEHADKFLITYFLGLDALGLYTIGISTGRLLLHFIKPLSTIYYSYLVNHKPSRALLAGLAGGLTLIGFVAAWLLQFYFSYILGATFMDAYPMAAVIVAGLGIYGIGVVSYYSAVYHRDADIRIPTLTNIVTAVVITSYLLAAITMGGAYALLLCAASYPLRELVNLAVISFLTKRFKRDA